MDGDDDYLDSLNRNQEEARRKATEQFESLKQRVEEAGFQESVAGIDWLPLLCALDNCRHRQSRGFVISGRNGCGKTQFLRTVQRLFFCKSIWVPCYDIASCEWMDWAETERQLSQKAFLLLDDFGADQPVSIYGTRVDRVSRLIMQWSDWPKKYRWPPAMLIIATNLTSSDVEARYGARVASRLRELNAVRMVGEDKRKPMDAEGRGGSSPAWPGGEVRGKAPRASADLLSNKGGRGENEERRDGPQGRKA